MTIVRLPGRESSSLQQQARRPRQAEVRGSGQRNHAETGNKFRKKGIQEQTATEIVKKSEGGLEKFRIMAQMVDLQVPRPRAFFAQRWWCFIHAVAHADYNT